MNASKKQFVGIVQEHQGLINSVCAIYYQHREDQEDARQDVILQLWKSFSTFKGNAKISTWIYRVSLNTLLSKVRKEKKVPKKESIDQFPFLTQYQSRFVDDDLLLLKQLITTLKDKEKAILVLHLEGYQNKEIAEMLSLTATNVSTHLNRIRTNLKQRVNHKTY